MSKLLSKNILTGALTVGFGAFIFFYASANYNMGSIHRMGPGMFPAGLGILLTGLGAIVLVQSFVSAAEPIKVRVWSPIFVLCGCAAFALTVRTLGLIPAAIAVTAISSGAELKFKPVSLVALCAVVCLIVWLVFTVGLRVPVPLFRWGF